MKKLYMILFLLAALTFSISAQSGESETKREKFDPLRDPFKDLQETVEAAKKQNKRIILDVGGEWCIWCHRLDAFIEQNKNIKDFLHDNYFVVKVNYSEENRNEKFLEQYPKSEGYPHLFVLEKNGKFLHSQNTGLLEKEKSYDNEKIMTFLKKWALKK